MSAVLARLLSELRGRRRSWLGLTLVIGLAGGAVLTAAQGARRSGTAYERFERASRAADVEVLPQFSPAFAHLDMARVGELPEVAVAGREHGYVATDPAIVVVTFADEKMGRDIQRPKLLTGRLPRPDHADEAAIAFPLEKQRHLRVGSRLRIEFLPGQSVTGQVDPEQAGSRGPPSAVGTLDVNVVGIEASPGEFPPRSANSSNTVILGAAFSSTALARAAFVGDLQFVRLERGAADLPSFQRGVERLAGGRPFISTPLAQQAGNVRRSIHLQSVALWLVAALLAVVAVLVLSQLLARQSFLESIDNAPLRALGMTRGQLWSVGLCRAAAAGALGALLASAAAVAASPLLPLGTARTAEPHPGVSVDPVVLGLSAAAIVLIVLGVAAVPAWRDAGAAATAATDAGDGGRLSPTARALGSRALPPAAMVGVRMALEPGSGRSAVPVRSSLLCVTVAVAALSVSLVFAASLSHLLGTPRLYGWNWDAHLEENGPGAPPVLPTVTGDSRIEAVARADTGVPLAVGSVDTVGLSIVPVKGTVAPVLTAGRLPRTADEVALGATTMRKTHAHIGSTVPVRITAIQSSARPRRVVGQVVLPPISDTDRLGSGLYQTYPSELALVPGVQPPPATDVFVRFRAGVDRRAALADLGRRVGDAWVVISAEKPADLVNFGQVQDLPLLLAALVAALGVATLAHTLVTSISRRRRDLALLKTLGFLPSQVRGAVAWQATTLTALAVLIGLPAGAIAGRALWTQFARQLGTVAEPVTPALALALTIPAAVVVANAIAAAPAFVAARTRAGVTLRAE